MSIIEFTRAIAPLAEQTDAAAHGWGAGGCPVPPGRG